MRRLDASVPHVERRRFELSRSRVIAEQLIRPTGVVDPEMELRPTRNQIDDLLNEIRRREEVGERTLVTTLTKKMSEDLTDYLLEAGVRARYLHSEIDTLDRIDSGAFFVGTLLGALASLALVLTVVSGLGAILPAEVVVAVLVSLIAAAALHDLGLPVPLPYRERQVPEWLREMLPPSAVAFVFGAMLGVGFVTLFTYSSHLALLAVLPLLPSLSVMVAAVIVFALGKTLVLAGVAGARSLEEVPRRFRWSRARIRVLRATTAGLSIALASTLVMRDGGSALAP